MASRAMTPATTGPGALFRARQSFPRPRIDDVATAVREQLRRPEVAATLASRSTVALAVGSRGIAAIAAVITATVAELRHQGHEVFVVPSMGSHGGATADGQVEVLAHLGITAEGIGAPIRSSMDVVEVATVVSAHGNPVHLVMDAIAWNDADTVIPVNRIKPHTGFKGPVESGICKMLAIGLGKHEGARRLHGEGYEVFDSLILEAGRAILDTGKVGFGLGLVENAYGELAVIEREQQLLEAARTLMPGILLPVVDVLIVEEFGKNISGVGMDANVTGRGEMGVALPGFAGPKIARIVVLGLTAETGGNAHGIGLADVITERAFGQIDRHATWTNALTAGSLACGRIPIARPTEAEAIASAIHSLPGVAPEQARIVRIKNTLHLFEIAVAENLLDACRSVPGMEVVGEWDGTWAE